MARKTYFILATILSFLIRFVFFNYYVDPENSVYSNPIAYTIGFETPHHSFESLYEALYNVQLSKNPYSANVYSGSPLTLSVFLAFLKLGAKMADLKLIALCVIFAADAISAFFLQKMIEKYQFSSKGQIFTFSPEIFSILYILNPFAVLQNVSLSFIDVHHAFIFSAFYLAISKKNYFAACVLYAISALLYPRSIIFLCPLISFYSIENGICVAQKEKTSLNKTQLRNAVCFVATVSLVVSLTLFCLRQIVFGGNWDFLVHGYYFQLSGLGDTPNFGIYWYFNAEVFERFRYIFVIIMNTQIEMISIPLFFKLNGNPFFLAISLMLLSISFKQSLVLADFGIYLILLASLELLYKKSRFVSVFMVTAIYGITTSMVLWNILTNLENMNLNYLNTCSLIINFCTSYTVVDLLYAFIKEKEKAENREKKTD